jgi:DNA polymerase elongation subunit (family B)
MFRKPITSLPTNDIEMQVVDWSSYDMDEIEENLDDSDDSDKSEHKKMSEKMFNIKAYGLNADGQSVCVHINEFTPYFFFKIPQSWSKSNVTKLMTELNSKVNYYAKKALISSDIVMRKEFYGFTNDTMFKFVRLVFKNYGAFCQYKKHLEEPIKLNGKNYTFQLYESKIAPLLRFLHCRDVIPAAWIKIGKGKYDYKDITRCQIEISANWKDIQFLDKSEIGPIMIASFDIECTSTDGSFPVASRKGDQVIQIGTTVHKNGEKECFLHHIVTLKTPEEISKEEVEAENLIVEYYDDERSVILAWAKFIDKLDPDIITGYNIWGFDMPYLYNRVKHGNGGETFDYSEVFIETLARCKDFESKGYDAKTKTNYLRVARYVEQGLSSAALGDNTLKFFEIEGVVGIDLMKVVQRDHKLDSYKLDKVAEVFLGLNKIDLPPRKIFENYRDGSPAKIKEIAVYCLKDCVLVNKLMMKLNILPNNIGMANVCCVPLSYIFLRGQGIKIFSLIAKECRKENYLIKDVKFDPEDKTGYEGAIVFEPKPGIYFDPIAVNDFASLYPSSMIAENLSHDSLVWVKIFDNYDRLLKLINGYGDVIEEYDIDGTLIKKSGNLKYMGLEEYNYNEIKYDNFEKYDDNKHKLVPKKFIIKAKPNDKVLTGYTICCFVEKKDGSKSLLPKILQKLLKARKDTRKKIEYSTIKLETGEEYSGLLNEDKTEIVCEKEGNIVIDPTTIVNCEDTFSDFMKTVWDSLQLAFKVSCNSLYGQTGAKTSSVYNKYIAASTTKTGRATVLLAKDKTKELFPKSKLIYGDSVTGNTPLLLKCYDDTIEIKTIETLCEEWDPYEEFKPFDTNRKEKQQGKTNYRVWTVNGWANIKRVIRHKTHKKIYRVNTHTGCVDVSEDHSLLDIDKNKIKPTDCKIGTELLHSYPIFDEYKPMKFSDLYDKLYKIEQLSKDEYEAFIFGFFYGDGSCGYYDCKSAPKYSWALNNKNDDLLNKCLVYLKNIGYDTDFKILDTIKSSGVNKLVPKGSVKYMVNKYRGIFYDKDKHKIIPKNILNGSNNIKYQFLVGYYASDGNKCVNENTKCIRFDNKGKIGSAQLYYLMKSLGYKCSINTRKDKPSIYRITSTIGNQRKNAIAIKKLEIIDFDCENNYIYDLETDVGTFNGGIGEIELKNTDSIFVSYMDCVNEKYGNNLTDEEKLKYTLEFQEKAANYVTSCCKSPHSLTPEKIFYPYIIFAKKRYCSNKYLYPETKKFKQDNMGIALKRRDSAPILKDIYGGVIKTILNERDINKAKQFFKDEVNNLLSGNVDIKKLIVSKSLKGNYANPTTIAHKVLADRMGERDPGNKPMPSDRIPYCYIDICNLKCHQCNAGNLRADNCKCVKCMQLFCSTHLHNHRKICKTLCRFCKKTKPSNEIKECKTCKGWYCPEDMVKHTIRTDKYKVEHFDKCKKPLEPKILQGDILENPDYIKEKGLIIDYKYYLDHQIETHCMQLFGLTMDNPESLIASAIRKYNNNKSGNQEISKWFTPLSTPTPEILQSTVLRTVQSLHPMTLRIKKKKIEDIEAQSITQWTQTTDVDDNEEIVNDNSNVKIL